MKTIPAGEFKAKCLAIMDDVLRTGEPVRVTKNGRPTVLIVPDSQAEEVRETKFGMFADEITWIGDVITPLGTEDREVYRD